MRSSGALVKSIMDTTLTEDEITPFLVAASKLCDKVFANSSGYGEELEEEIEKWLGAHFASVARDPRVKSETAGPASATYFGQDGTGLKSSPYGQQVLVLDYNGMFAGIGDAPTFELEVLG